MDAEFAEVADEVVGPVADSALALVSPLRRIEAGLAAMKAESERADWDVETAAGEAAAREFRRRCVKVRTSADAAYERGNKPLLEAQREARALVARIKTEIQPIEEVWDTRIKAKEDRLERERIERERIERERVANIRSRIASIGGAVLAVAASGSAEIEREIAELRAIAIDESGFGEFMDEAEGARLRACAELETMLARAMLREQAEAEVAAQREALRLQAEQLRRDAEEAKRRQEEAEAQLAAQRAELAAAHAQAQRAEEEARQRIARDTEAERKRLAEERAEQRRQLEAERAENARQRDAFEAEKQAELDRVAVAKLAEKMAYEIGAPMEAVVYVGADSVAADLLSKQEAADMLAAQAQADVLPLDECVLVDAGTAVAESGHPKPPDEEILSVLCTAYAAPAERVIDWIVCFDVRGQRARLKEQQA